MKKSLEEIKNYTRERLVFIDKLLRESSVDEMNSDQLLRLVREVKRVLSAAIYESGAMVFPVNSGAIIYPDIMKEASDVFFKMHNLSILDLSVKNKRRVIASARQMFIHVLSEVFKIDSPIIAAYMGRTRTDIINSTTVSSALISSGDYYILAYEDFLKWAKARVLEGNQRGTKGQSSIMQSEMELKHIKVNGKMYCPQEAGIPNESETGILGHKQNHPVCIVREIKHGGWLIEYFDWVEHFSIEGSHTVGTHPEDTPNVRLIVYPKSIEEVRYKRTKGEGE